PIYPRLDEGGEVVQGHGHVVGDHVAHHRRGGVDGDDVGGRLLVGQGREGHRRGLADRHPGHVGLAEAGLDLEGVEVDQGDQGLARRAGARPTGAGASTRRPTRAGRCRGGRGGGGSPARRGLTHLTVDGGDGARGGGGEHGAVLGQLGGGERGLGRGDGGLVGGQVTGQGRGRLEGVAGQGGLLGVLGRGQRRLGRVERLLVPGQSLG